MQMFLLNLSTIYFEYVIPSMKINSLHTQFGTPLRIAKSKGHDHIVQLLREANMQTKVKLLFTSTSLIHTLLYNTGG